MTPQLTLLIYVVVPLWLAAGFADWLCHRRSAIASTSGAPESALHLVMLAETGVPLLGALYLDVNALILGVLVAAFIAHELTAWVDVRYAIARRRVGVFEQFVHSVLEMAPLAVIVLLASAHWPQWLALFGRGDEPARFALVRSSEPPPIEYTVALAVAIFALALAPYLEELARGLRARAPKQNAG
ncbi:MAG TPA: hypothetical protein VJ696_10625 [Rhodanobacteraceae bacterium]|nr:hypothetical protein [Rhodanobacteraceae bacterium]